MSGVLDFLDDLDQTMIEIRRAVARGEDPTDLIHHARMIVVQVRGLIERDPTGKFPKIEED
jgi:hypothetical protein